MVGAWTGRSAAHQRRYERNSQTGKSIVDGLGILGLIFHGRAETRVRRQQLKTLGSRVGEIAPDAARL
jgi:hypothetical protein